MLQQKSDCTRQREVTIAQLLRINGMSHTVWRPGLTTQDIYTAGSNIQGLKLESTRRQRCSRSASAAAALHP